MRSKIKGKENLISVVIVIFFVLGFFVLNSFGSGITGYGGFDFSIPENVNFNESIIEDNLQNQSFDFETEAVWYGTAVITSQWGSALAPENLTRTMDDRSVDFVFNATASGIHNDSGWGDYAVLNLWFEENASDITGRNNGTATAGVTNTTGIVGYAYEFDGKDDAVTTGEGIGLDITNYTLSLWLKYKKLPTTDGWIAARGRRATVISFGIDYDLSPGPRFRTWVDDDGGWGPDISSDGTFIPIVDTWYHLASTFNGTTLSLYVNGELEDSDYSAISPLANVDNFVIGTPTDDWEDFNGTIDEILLFNRSLSSKEISGIYNASLYGETRSIENCSVFLSVDDGSYTRNVTGDLVIHNDSNLDEYVVGNWYFEKDGADESGLGNTAAVFGSISNITGKVGYAYEVDGAGDYVTIADDNSLSFTDGAGTDKPFSTSSWVRMDEAAGFWVFQKHGPSPNKEYSLTTASGTKIYFYLYDEANSAYLRIGYDTRLRSYEGQWIHLATTYDGSETTAGMRIYLNGVRVDDLDYSTGSYTGMPNGGTDVKMGNQPGAVDEVIFFNRSLSSAEVNAIYNNSKGVNFEGLNTSWSVEFGYDNHSIDWKIGCYDDLGIQWNTSEMNTELSDTVNMSKPNIGAHAYYDPNYVVGYWRFEENNGSDTFDETGKNNGTLKGDVKWCPDEGDSQKWNCSGRVGKGYLFDGVDDIINVSDDDSLDFGTNTDFTICSWIKTSITSTEFIVDKRSANNNGILFYKHSSDYIQLEVNAVDTYSTTTVHDDLWHHACGVADRDGNAQIYIDGKADGSAESISGAGDVDNSHPLIIGARSFNTPDSYWDGSIDEVTIWNRSLSALEIQQLYYSQSETYNSSYTIQDISASNNNTYDKDNDTIKYIYNWYVNNASMAVLNMPFEAVNNGSEQNFSRDYSDNENHFSETHFDQASFKAGSGWNRTGGGDGFGAYEFDGSDNYLRKPVANWQSGDEQGTISAWVKTTDTDATIFASCRENAAGEMFLFNVGSAGALALHIVGDSGYTVFSAVAAVNDGAWHHVAVKSDGSSTFFYKDGQELTTVETVGTDVGDWLADVQNRASITMGAYRRNTLGSYFTGTIDDVLIFNRSLSAEQILALYKNQTQTIKHTETNPGERWHAEITANDGYGDSIKYNTSELLIDEVTLIIETPYPFNNTNWSTSYINFTYNVSDGDSVAGVNNCSLLIQDSSGWEVNKTDLTIDSSGVNQTINITFSDGHYNWTIGCYDKDNDQTNSTTGVLTIATDITAPAISNLKFYALNSSKDLIGVDETSFNFSNIEDIEHMRINFTLSDIVGIDRDIDLFYTANGTHGCALGNNQSTVCYNYTNAEATRWIHFKNGTTTSTFQNWGTSGDYINCSWNGSSTVRTYSCTIDEHYNPNVCKHYPLNFSDIKWQSGAEKIKKRTIWKVQMNSTIVPLDANEYKLDFRVNYTTSAVPTQPILAYLCNTTYSTGDPETSSECQLVAGKLPNDLQDDGTKFRGIFTKSLVQNLGDIGYVLIESDTRGNRYYIMKTVDYLGQETIHTSISTNIGASYTTLADGYESELNINWFYNGTTSESNVTQFVMKIQANDTLNNLGNSSLYVMSWVKSGVKNEPPIVDIIVPQINTNLSGTIEINWTTAEPEGDTYITNITLRDPTNTFYIASLLSNSFSNYSWSNSSSYSDGIYNLTVESCESATSDKFCGIEEHNITLDNTNPIVNLQYPLNETIFSQADIDFTYNATDSPTQIKNCSLYLGYETTNINVSNSSDATITMTINQSFNITFNLANQTIYWRVGCYNDAILQTNSTLRNFILKTSSPRESQGRGSSPGTGSSAGRFASKITESIATISGNVYTIDSLVPGETGLEILDSGLSITKIIMDSAREAKDIEIKIDESRNTRVEKPDRRVYRYITIETNIPVSVLNKVKILFKVQKNWGDDIKLLRYNDNWQILETNRVSDDQYYEYYEGISPGFSVFAISAEKISIKQIIEKVAQEIVEKPTKLEVWLYAIIPIIILILAGLFVLYCLIKLIRKHKRITLSVVLLGLGFIILITPFTDEILYFAILPLSIIVVIISVLCFVIYKILKRKK